MEFASLGWLRTGFDKLRANGMPKPFVASLSNHERRGKTEKFSFC
jgi:hypothetical protein